MFICQQCEKEFKTQRALNAHATAHKSGPRYSISRKSTHPVKTHVCMFCSIEFKHSRSSENKFCCLEHFHLYQWEFVEKPKIESGGGGNLKKYLVEKFGDECSECGTGSTWNGKELTLQVDHIDGNSDNNFPSNIRLMCPNCHTQTETYGSKNYGSARYKNTRRNRYLREYKAGLV